MSMPTEFETLNPVLALVLMLVSLVMGIFPALMQLGLLLS